MINRAVVILKFKQPAIDWINEVDEDGDIVDINSVNNDRIVYLIPDRAAFDEDTIRSWVELNHEALFKNELGFWYTDEDSWPQDLSLAVFDAWFEVECHSMLVDTSDEPIVEEVYEEDESGGEEVH